ncbi:MAG: fibronectin type III domain-containing protein [Pyrinomonadaceae bacterium]|nr:fibronectin type III domain-containing protein [Pyrinomonadaceae bacterium]
MVFAAGCGKRKPPLPPTERVVQRAEIAAFQRGPEVILSWKMPIRNAPAGSVLNIDRIDVYRLAEPLTAPQGISEEEFASRSVTIGTIKVNDDDFGAKTMTYRDTLQFAGQQVRLRYAVRYVNSAGQKAAFSNFFLLEPAARVAQAPASLSATLSQEAVTLNWTRPAANVDGSTPANIIGFNIYRTESNKVPATLMNRTPVIDDSYADRTFAFEKEYLYFIRTVSLGTGGESVESSESNIVNVKTADTFPPSAPSSITIAASPTTISLFFPANPENDITGYHVYRSDDRNRPLGEWERMTPELMKATTFQDLRVESGKTYHYYVTATDKYGNVSQPSEVVSETVP